MKIGLVIPVLSQYKMAVDLIAHLRSAHTLETFVIPQYRHQRPLSGAWNYGMREAFRKNCDFALVMNDDVLLSPWAIDAMVDTLGPGQHQGLAVATATNARGVMGPDDVLNLEEPSLDDIGAPPSGPDFACFMMTQMTYDMVGDFDENFTPAYFEDNDYHRRVNLLGLRAEGVKAAVMYHYGSQTQNHSPKKPVVPPPLFVRNRQYYVSKWGGEPGHETYDTPFNKG